MPLLLMAVDVKRPVSPVYLTKYAFLNSIAKKLAQKIGTKGKIKEYYHLICNLLKNIIND